MLKLYIMCGIAFAGKSTLARKIAEHTGSTLVGFDTLWIEKEKEQPIPKDAIGWRMIRKLGQQKVLEELTRGHSVVYDDNNVKREHREELRNVARQVGVESVVIYLNTPLETIRARELENKVTGVRHEVELENFQTVLEQLEPPLPDENALLFTPDTKIEDFLQKLK